MEHASDPSELLLSGVSFVRDVRRVLPLLRVYDFAVPQKESRDGAGQEQYVVSFALNEIKARNLK